MCASARARSRAQRSDTARALLHSSSSQALASHCALPRSLTCASPDRQGPCSDACRDCAELACCRPTFADAMHRPLRWSVPPATRCAGSITVAIAHGPARLRCFAIRAQGHAGSRQPECGRLHQSAETELAATQLTTAYPGRDRQPHRASDPRTLETDGQGVEERDPIRGRDSFNTFREILQIATENDVRRLVARPD